MGYSLGVDLGTTFTAAAIGDGQHAEIVPLGDRSPQAASVIYQAPDGSFRYGEAAERHAAGEPERIAREFKRRIGDQTPVFVAGSPMSAHALSKALLGWTVEQVIGGQGAPPDRVVVTCPANWGPYRRELMSQVISLNTDAPIEVRSEPEAAAVHFAASRRVGVGESVAVYDLGGGTFDAAVLRRTSERAFELLGSPDGIEQLGGVDFDEAVFERVSRGIDWARLDPEDPETLTGLARLRRDCTEAKEALSSETETTVPILLGARPTRVRLTRSEFQELIGPLLADTVEILDRVVRRSGVTPDELAAIVLVGGSSRVPLVSELITARFRRPAVLSPQPKLCVAMGAALLAAIPAADVPPTPAAPVATPPPIAPSTVANPPPIAPVTVADPPPIAPVAVTPQSSIAPTSTNGPAEPPAVRTEPAPAAAQRKPSEPNRPRRERRRTAYRLATAGFALLALLLMIVGPAAGRSGAYPWNRQFVVAAGNLPPATTLTPTIFGLPLTRHPDSAADGAFDLAGSRVFLSGPLHATLAQPQAGRRTVTIAAADRWSPQRFLTVPFAALVLTALFSFAYAESILRTIRGRRTAPRAGELTGLVGSGLVAGVAAILATWVLGDRLPTVSTTLGIVVCVCAAVGLLAFAWIRVDEPPAQ